MTGKAVIALCLALLGTAVHANDGNSTEAMLRLINSRSSGSPKAYAEAAEIVAREAEDGRPLQQFIIAIASRDAAFPQAAKIDEATRKRYLDESRPKIKALAENRDNALAWYLLSLESNDMKMLRKAVDAENVQALNAWGTIAITKALESPLVDTNDLEQVLFRSYTCFKKAAEKNDMNGLYNLGMCYLHGYGVRADEFRAMECFKAAANAGHPEAINNVGGFYRDGIVVDKDPVVAARWFAKSADHGNAYGELNYALALQRGEGVAADPERAVRMFKASAQQGNIEAMNAYAMCLYNGDGIEKNRREAVKWYRAAAERGYPPAMENYASCFESGEGGLMKDLTAGMVWRMRARAARGDRNAAAWLVQNGYNLR